MSVHRLTRRRGDGHGWGVRLQMLRVWVFTDLLHPRPYRSQRVYFAGFARVLAYFRPIDEEDAALRDPKQPEPLNSRMNKLRCECVRPAQARPPPPSFIHTRRDLGTSHCPCQLGLNVSSGGLTSSSPLLSQLHFSSMIWIGMGRSPGMKCYRSDVM